MRRHNFLIIAVAVTMILLVFAVSLPSLAAAADNPGGQASSGSAASAGGQSAKEEGRFYDNLKNFYLLGLSLVGISALLMIVWGGIDYIIAGDSASRVEAGKKKITNALWGILIAGVSYALLYTINPDLVKIRIGASDQYKSTNKTP